MDTDTPDSGDNARVSVGLARGQTVEQAMARAVTLAGGLEFIQPGQTVLVKPNANSPDPYPGTTNPEVVYEAVKMIRQRDPGRIIVADRSWFAGGTADIMKKVGIDKAAEAAGAEVMILDDGPWRETHLQEARHWDRSFRIATILDQVDHLISLPVVKTHMLATFTMSLKNSVGLVEPDDRVEMLHHATNGPDGFKFGPESHAEPAFGSRIAEINLAFPVSLVIMDGTRSFVSGGPTKGKMVEPGIIVASRDRIANDAAGLALLKTLGTEERIQSKSVWEQPQIRRAMELGLGVNMGRRRWRSRERACRS